MNVKKASGAKPIYMYRPVMNAEQIHAWAAEQGFQTVLPADDMHVTVVFSRAAFDAELSEIAEYEGRVTWDNVVIRGGKRTVTPLGDKGAVVLKIQSERLQDEHNNFRAMGASWDYQEYSPHISLTYNGAGLDVSGVTPFEGDIVLGPLRAKPLNPDWDSRIVEVLPGTLDEVKKINMDMEVEKSADILKLDAERRIAWGWASVSTFKGDLVTDLHGDTITPGEMEKMADRFMASTRAAKAMHEGAQIGEVLHSLPLTNDIAKAFGMETDREGWIIGMKIHDDDVWKAFKDGTYKAFSIGGMARRREIE